MNIPILLKEYNWTYTLLTVIGVSVLTSKMHLSFYLVAWQAAPASASMFSRPRIHRSVSPRGFHAVLLNRFEMRRKQSTSPTHAHTSLPWGRGRTQSTPTVRRLLSPTAQPLRL